VDWTFKQVPIIHLDFGVCSMLSAELHAGGKDPEVLLHDEGGAAPARGGVGFEFCLAHVPHFRHALVLLLGCGLLCYCALLASCTALLQCEPMFNSTLADVLSQPLPALSFRYILD